jgi:hypothetical protein
MTLPKKTKTEDFSRYEFKYLLSPKLRQNIEYDIAHFMCFDGYVHPELDNRYFVRSLYFDNNSADHYYEKIDGIRSRRKFRLRTYERFYQTGLPIFLEIKGRYIDRTYKHRVTIFHEHLHLFKNPQDAFELLHFYPHNWIVKQFVFDTVVQRIKPQVLVDYLRRPYTSDYDMNFRMTFDEKLQVCPSMELFRSDVGGWRQCVAGYSILEIKFHRRIPAWFHKIIQNYNLRRLSISKFCKGMETSGLATEL